ncbi:MAG: proline--tRNA ligase [Candidatus Diapherotrites archaeon]
MSEENTLGITTKKSEDFVEWYNQVVLKAGLADYAPMRGFMVIKPNGYALWESIQEYFNKVLERLKVSNAYFPLLIPENFFLKEAEHAKGFAPELAWIEKEKGEMRLAIRPTSETIIYNSFSTWVRSWRDLPLRVNQWCNVLRWEVKQTKLFLRTREFLWHEAHCIYATKEECDKEVIMVLKEYKKLCEELLAIPVIAGYKTEHEKFAGAFYTTTLEALMPDGKALQMATSHNLGQGFAKAFKISFLDENKNKKTPWQSSWGFSTRLIGALVMTHGDDKGLIIPPLLAKKKIVIIPILFTDSKEQVLEKAYEVAKKLEEFGAFVDERDNYNPGWKFSDWELKGIPLRIEIGPKDIEKNQVVIVRRDTGKKEFVKLSELQKRTKEIIIEMQKNLFTKAKKFLEDNIIKVKNEKEFLEEINKKKLVLAPFCCEVECEKIVKEKFGITSRCIPLESEETKEKCIFCSKDKAKLVLFGKSY